MINQSERMKMSRQYQSLEEQSYNLFRQDVSLLKQKQEYEATGAYSKPFNYFQIPGRVLHLPSILSRRSGKRGERFPIWISWSYLQGPASRISNP
ncbi:sporulation peptidase YabG [Mycobacteroides abscessus subsp. abscessus]|nr:sporulation peptidase YabG [Mycobacteroides abscessus subsp. abscessus]